MTIIQTLENIGEQCTVQGWVDSIRNHGKLTFIDLRDHTGKLQCVARGLMGDFNIEDVVELTGNVKARPDHMANPNLATGSIEFSPTSVRVLNKAGALPIPVDTDGREINEEKRLRYRYLDLRRERMQANIRTRAKMIRMIRESLEGNGFIEIETPILTQSTKEGARDFVVPSRFHPGQVYALPQSPQQYKQLLMAAGFEKYYQIARCFRDEALRLDRGFEFTQIDLEMAFCKQSDIFTVVKNFINCATQDEVTDESFPIITYAEAMAKYGVDKPDIRTDAEKEAGKLAFCWVTDFPMFKKQTKDEVQDSKSEWTFMHNPFSSPIEEHKEWLLAGTNVDKIIAQQYDLVCNGIEIGSGSIRAHTSEMLKATYKVMGYSDVEIQASVGHMLEAFDLGTPPHGGIALGIDRLAMLICKEASIKEVIAFPMTGSGKTSIMEAPTPMTKAQQKELGL